MLSAPLNNSTLGNINHRIAALKHQAKEITPAEINHKCSFSDKQIWNAFVKHRGVAWELQFKPKWTKYDHFTQMINTCWNFLWQWQTRDGHLCSSLLPALPKNYSYFPASNVVGSLEGQVIGILRYSPSYLIAASKNIGRDGSCSRHGRSPLFFLVCRFLKVIFRSKNYAWT